MYHKTGSEANVTGAERPHSYFIMIFGKQNPTASLLQSEWRNSTAM